MGESLHMALDNHNLLNLDWKPMRKRDSLILPLKSGLKDEQLRVLKDLSFEIHFTYQEFERAEVSNNPHTQLARTVSDWLTGKSNAAEIEPLVSQLPRKWERYGDMIILPEQAFESDDWVKLLNRCTKSQLEGLA